MSKTYTARNGATQYRPSMRWAERVVREDNNEGFCLACGSTQEAVEPDARRYRCDACGEPKVYGAEQLILMGLPHGKPGREG